MKPLRSVSDALARGCDNFGVLRLALALSVMASHALVIVHGPSYVEPLARWSGFDLGQHAVNLFFAISGFLVIQSFERRDLASYTLARAARLLPGLVVATLFSAFVIGSLATKHDLGAYWSDPRTWGFVARVLLAFDGHALLPGVFEGNLVREVMITIWTIKYEIACYMLLAAAGALGLFRWRWGLPLSLLVFAGTLLAAAHTGVPGAVQSLARFGLCFATGALAWRHRGRLPLDWRVVAGLALAVALARSTALDGVSVLVAESYAILWLALLPLPLGRLPSPQSDLSYGIYLYGYPVEQLAQSMLNTASPLLLLGVAVPATLVLAAASWRFIEKPALRLKTGRPRRALDRPLAARQ